MKLDWQILITDSGSRFPKTLYFELEGTQSFRYGIDEDGGFCLFFAFKQDAGNKEVEQIELAKIRLHEEKIDYEQTLVLTLLDQTFLSQFSDLILNIVSEVSKEKGNQKSKFIQICNEWFELFEPASGILSRQELQGIFGELTFLKYLLNHSSFSFNDILSSWKGPFGKGHDFELVNNNNFEVKSTGDGVALINISSEFQLDRFQNQKLVLVVQRFLSSPANGSNLSCLIEDIHLLLKKQVGIRMNLFWTALSKAGLAIAALDTYNNQLFQIISMVLYDCSAVGFPAIRRSDISDAIRNVRYDLNLPDLSQFLLDDLNNLI